MNSAYITAAVCICALITVLLRAFPFLLVKAARRYAALFAWLGEAMPPAMMAVLAVYAVSTLQWRGAQAAVSAIALILLIVLGHRLRRPLISLSAALAVYVIGQSLMAGGWLG